MAASRLRAKKDTILPAGRIDGAKKYSLVNHDITSLLLELKVELIPAPRGLQSWKLTYRFGRYTPQKHFGPIVVFHANTRHTHVQPISVAKTSEIAVNLEYQ